MKKLLSPFDLKNLTITDTGRKYKPSKEYKQASSLIWRDLLAKIRKNGGRAWNGQVYRLNSISKRGEKILLTLDYLDYKTHYAIDKLYHLTKGLDFKNKPNGIYVSFIPRTKDGKIVYGVKSKKTISKYKIGLLGGTLNRDEIKLTKGEDLRKFTKNELKEELGLEKSKIKEIKGRGIYQVPSGRIAILLDVELLISSKFLMRTLKLNFEHKNILCIPPNEVKILKSQKINPFIAYLARKSMFEKK